jgi:RHS repeat-associated protein
MGSLIGGHRDPGGAMYMRNRYYDPATGQFTQTDPIGIAGGLNTYGFAAGDPVGNWDPFGTCAWGIGPDAAFGRCSANDLRMAPQGEVPRPLTEPQREQVRAAIANLSGQAHTQLTRMLGRGQIMTLSRTHLGRAANVEITPGGLGTRYRIMLQRDNQEDPAFFTYGPYDASWIIAHEYGHVEQWRNNALIHLPEPQGSVRSFFNENLYSPNYSLLQRDANLYACASVVSAPPIFQTICDNGGHSPP